MHTTNTPVFLFLPKKSEDAGRHIVTLTGIGGMNGGGGGRGGGGMPAIVDVYALNGEGIAP